MVLQPMQAQRDVVRRLALADDYRVPRFSAFLGQVREQAWLIVALPTLTTSHSEQENCGSYWRLP